MTTSLAGHEWQRVRFVPPSGPENAYYGRKCLRCGLKTYSWGRLTRWKYADGQVFDTATIDEPTCHGKAQMKCDKTTDVRIWTGFTFKAGCVGDAGHKSIKVTPSSRHDDREHEIVGPDMHATAPQPLYIDGRYGQIIWKA